MNVHLISFAAHNDNRYENRRKTYAQVATDFNVFNSVTLFSNFNCFDFCPELAKHKDYMPTTKRGYGYWIWKFYIVREFLNTIPENDILLYTDIGCTFNYNGRKRMYEYFDMVNEKNSLLFELVFPELSYTKMDTYRRIFPNSDEHFYTKQRCSGIFFIKNTKHNRDVFEELKIIHGENDYRYVTDEPSELPNDSSFVDHRHDQSLLSLVGKKYNFFAIPDETYWIDWETEGKNYPIWARRIVY
jgi:hypothetical protein